MRETWAGYVTLLLAGIQEYGLIIGTTGIIIILLSFLLRYPSARFHNTIINHRHGFFPPPKIKSSDPFLGLDIAKQLRQAVAERRFLAFLLDLFRESGIWTLEVNLLGQTNVWTADPEIIRTILATRSRDWHIGTSRKELVDPVAGRNILTREGEDWRHTRAMMRPAFVKRQFGDMGELEKHVDRLMEHLPADGETVVDLKSLFYMLSMDVSTEFLFGVSTNNLSMSRDVEGVEFAEALDLIQGNIVRGQWLGRFGEFLFPNKQLKKAIETMNKRFDRFISLAMKHQPSSQPKDKNDKPANDESQHHKYNLIHELTRLWPSESERIRSESLMLLIAGRDTTASALTNFLFYLARSPEVWQKIRQECLAVATDRPMFEELRGLKYLNNCVREGLRMLNPTVDLTRTAAVDTVLPRGGGPDGQSPTLVRKGTNFNLWIYVMHHRKDIWGDDADEFRPERWDGDGKSFGHHAYSPFGAGARICIGQQLAQMETIYTTFRLARKFSTIEPADLRPWTENLGLATSSAYGTRVRLVE